jgi:hypothetical protein
MKKIFETITHCYGAVVYHHKTQEKQVEILANQIPRDNFISILLIFIILSLSLFQANCLHECINQILPFLTAAELAFLLFLTGSRKEERKTQHIHTANELRDLRERYINLLTDIKSANISEQDAIKLRDSLHERMTMIINHAPKTSIQAYEKARKAIKENGEQTFSKSELINILPAHLQEYKDS